MRRNPLMPTMAGLTLAFCMTSGFTCSGDHNAKTQDAKSGDAQSAIDFSAPGADGKTHTLQSLTEGGKTLVLYFVKNGCGANPRAVPLFKKVADPYLEHDKVNFYVVFNDNKPNFEGFKRQFGVKFNGLLDPDHEVIKRYGVRSSQGVAVIRDGKFVKRWKGFSKASLTELGEILAKASGKPFDADLSGAPTNESFG